MYMVQVVNYLNIKSTFVVRSTFIHVFERDKADMLYYTPPVLRQPMRENVQGRHVQVTQNAIQVKR